MATHKKAKAKKDSTSTKLQAQKLWEEAPKGKFPKGLKPMLATLTDKPVEDSNWLYEVKWDGYRALAFLSNEKVELLSRNNKSFNEKFYPIHDALQKLHLHAVLDGEIVVVQENGLPNFEALQGWRSEADGTLMYYVFDLLWLDGKDLSQQPLIVRRLLLKELIPLQGNLRLSEEFEDVKSFLKIAGDKGLEGIMAKKKDSLYYSGDRSREWLKIKTNKRQEMVIGGYTRNEGSSKPFSALLVGVFNDGKLQYTGKIGTGFSQQTQKEMLQLFKPLQIAKCPFTFVPDINKPSRFRPNPPEAKATWLKPQLICEVSFTEMTSDGVMRHPSFEGMRADKRAYEIVLEKPLPTKEVMQEENVLTGKVIKPAKRERKTLLNPKDETQVRELNGHELKFTNLSKVYWPKEKYTKRDLINYYYQVAPYMVPYLKDRPQSLNRYPNGINGESFYQKDVTGKAPAWIETFKYYSEADHREKHFLVCSNEASLLYMASLGCIEMNPWSSTVQQPDNPDWCIMDLDPDGNPFNQVIETALVIKEILDDIKVPSYCKTSGSTGLHIYIPFGAKYSYEQSKEFGRVIATLANRELPKFTSIERATKNRKGKIYIDFLQNRPQATLAAPYSVRPKPGATVSMPLHWEEVKKGLKMTDFTIANAIGRVKEQGDIFKPVLGKGINLQKVIKQLSSEIQK
ncbi:MAG: DNA ligase D [Chitinophagales bacterium]